MSCIHANTSGVPKKYLVTGVCATCGKVVKSIKVGYAEQKRKVATTITGSLVPGIRQAERRRWSRDKNWKDVLQPFDRNTGKPNKMYEKVYGKLPE